MSWFYFQPLRGSSYLDSSLFWVKSQNSIQGKKNSRLWMGWVGWRECVSTLEKWCLVAPHISSFLSKYWPPAWLNLSVQVEVTNVDGVWDDGEGEERGEEKTVRVQTGWEGCDLSVWGEGSWPGRRKKEEDAQWAWKRRFGMVRRERSQVRIE